MPFVSRAQQRFAFATGQPWARKWAEHTPNMKKLPEKVSKKKSGSVLHKRIVEGK